MLVLTVLIVLFALAPLDAYASPLTPLERRQQRLERRLEERGLIRELAQIRREERLLGRRAAIAPVSAERVSKRTAIEGSTDLFLLREELLILVNLERKQYNLPPLARNRLLDRSAQAHAQDMRRRQYFDHHTPEGKNFDSRIAEAGYPDIDLETCNCSYRYRMGENIAKGQLDPKTAMRDWMNSPNHRDNILHPDFSEVGFGIAGDIWVQNFGDLEIREQ